MSMQNWLSKPIKGILLDITGVLYESGEGLGSVIEGSVDAVARLKSAGLPLRLLTNETCATKEAILKKLNHHGYSFVPEDIFSPIPAVKAILKEKNLRPHILVYPDVEEEFKEFEQTDPTCVVVGDADQAFSFENMNKAFNTLMAMKKPILYSLGKGKYYRHKGQLQLDVGAFVTALEYACDVESVVVGKPSDQYFKAALDDMGVSPESAVMVGDDINSDVGGAQKCGIRGVLVKTGKFNSNNLNHPTVKPDFIADNLSHAIDCLLKSVST
ncbi:UNVERIFIED_CONTAM: hypothetical protein GTU68_037258 [Idotea baltica]|nr:hypothetical protein [Idotea baltica]